MTPWQITIFLQNRPKLQKVAKVCGTQYNNTDIHLPLRRCSGTSSRKGNTILATTSLHWSPVCVKSNPLNSKQPMLCCVIKSPNMIPRLFLMRAGAQPCPYSSHGRDAWGARARVHTHTHAHSWTHFTLGQNAYVILLLITARIPLHPFLPSFVRSLVHSSGWGWGGGVGEAHGVRASEPLKFLNDPINLMNGGAINTEG